VIGLEASFISQMESNEFLQACRTGNIVHLQQMKAKGWNIDCMVLSNIDYLQSASQHPETIRFLINWHSKVYHHSILVTAATYQYDAIVRVMFDMGLVPIELWVSLNFVAMVRWIVTIGLDLNQITTTQGQSIFYLIRSHEMFDVLISPMPNFNSRRNYGVNATVYYLASPSNSVCYQIGCRMSNELVRHVLLVMLSARRYKPDGVTRIAISRLPSELIRYLTDFVIL